MIGESFESLHQLRESPFALLARSSSTAILGAVVLAKLMIGGGVLLGYVPRDELIEARRTSDEARGDLLEACGKFRAAFGESELVFLGHRLTGCLGCDLPIAHLTGALGRPKADAGGLFDEVLLRPEPFLFSSFGRFGFFVEYRVLRFLNFDEGEEFEGGFFVGIDLLLNILVFILRKRSGWLEVEPAFLRGGLVGETGMVVTGFKIDADDGILGPDTQIEIVPTPVFADLAVEIRDFVGTRCATRSAGV